MASPVRLILGRMANVARVIATAARKREPIILNPGAL